MKVDNEEIDINRLIKDIDFESNFLKRRNNDIFLTDNQVKVLNKYGIDYQKYTSLSELIFDLEQYLNNSYNSYSGDLEIVSQELSEMNYYQNTRRIKWSE